MKIQWRITGQHLFKTSQPPHETVYDKVELEADLRCLVEKYKLSSLSLSVLEDEDGGRTDDR